MEAGLIIAGVCSILLVIGIALERWRVRTAHKRWLRHLQEKK